MSDRISFRGVFVLVCKGFVLGFFWIYGLYYGLANASSQLAEETDSDPFVSVILVAGHVVMGVFVRRDCTWPGPPVTGLKPEIEAALNACVIPACAIALFSCASAPKTWRRLCVVLSMGVPLVATCLVLWREVRAPCDRVVSGYGTRVLYVRTVRRALAFKADSVTVATSSKNAIVARRLGTMPVAMSGLKTMKVSWDQRSCAVEVWEEERTVEFPTRQVPFIRGGGEGDGKQRRGV